MTPDVGYGLHHRTTQTHSDGTQRFFSAADDARQREVMAMIESQWGVRCVYLGHLTYLDLLIQQHERVIAWADVIWRNYTYSDLMARGGVWLKRSTYDLACRLAEIPLCLPSYWRGSVIFWRLLDGLYSADLPLRTAPETALGDDPRGAMNDREEVVLLRALQRVQHTPTSLDF